jgi:hypothetical protein
MATLPGVTLTANLQSILAGGELGGFVRITLCGFGPVLPCVPGTAMLADAAIPQVIGPQEGATPITQKLYGNDVIRPLNTFYEIAVLDQNKNVIQAGLYQFDNAAGSVELCSAPQALPPYGFYLGNLVSVQCTGTIPGTVYVAPGPIVGLFYNGILLESGQAPPQLSYTLSVENTTATLNFNTQLRDRIDALCIV